MAIAGSPRNIFRYSRCQLALCGRDTEKGWGPDGYPLLPNSECIKPYHRVSNAEQVRVARGKQPGPTAKVPNSYSVGKEVELSRQLGGWLRSSHPLKTEALDFHRHVKSGRGALMSLRMCSKAVKIDPRGQLERHQGRMLARVTRGW